MTNPMTTNIPDAAVDDFPPMFTPEQVWHEKLAALHREYLLKAEPIIAEICKIEARKPIPLFITQAEINHPKPLSPPSREETIEECARICENESDCESDAVYRSIALICAARIRALHKGE